MYLLVRTYIHTYKYLCTLFSRILGISVIVAVVYVSVHVIVAHLAAFAPHFLFESLMFCRFCDPFIFLLNLLIFLFVCLLFIYYVLLTYIVISSGIFYFVIFFQQVRLITLI